MTTQSEAIFELYIYPYIVEDSKLDDNIRTLGRLFVSKSRKMHDKISLSVTRISKRLHHLHERSMHSFSLQVDIRSVSAEHVRSSGHVILTNCGLPFVHSAVRNLLNK